MAEEPDAAERLAQNVEPRDRAAGSAGVANARLQAGVLRDAGEQIRMSPEERTACEALFARAAATVVTPATTGPATHPASFKPG